MIRAAKWLRKQRAVLVATHEATIHCKIREDLRLHSELGRTHGKTAAACGISPATVSDYLTRALRAGRVWQQAQSLSEAEVQAKLFVHIGRSEPDVRRAVNLPWFHRELSCHGVTLQQLWSDTSSRRSTQDGAGRRPYQYSQFCELYATWRVVSAAPCPPGLR